MSNIIKRLLIINLRVVKLRIYLYSFCYLYFHYYVSLSRLFSVFLDILSVTIVYGLIGYYNTNIFLYNLEQKFKCHLNNYYFEEEFLLNQN